MLTEQIKLTLKDAAKKLTGSKKRAFMAQVTMDYWNSSPRKAETELGWSRRAIATVGFSLENQLRIRLIYYPPYHSKYNSIER